MPRVGREQSGTGIYKKVGSVLSDPAVFSICHFRKRPNIPTIDFLKPA